jgi:hypothetical protein
MESLDSLFLKGLGKNSLEENKDKQGLKDVFTLKCQRCNDFVIDWDEDYHYIPVYAANQLCLSCMYG